MSTVKNLYKTLFETQENKLKTGIVGMIIITAMLAGVFYYEANAITVADLDDLKDMVESVGQPAGELREFTETGQRSGSTNENSATDEELTIDSEMLLEISCSLTWTDEDSSYYGGTNEPDEFKLTIIAPNSETQAESQFSSSGTVTARASLPNYEEADFVENYVGPWTIRVEAGTCGDDYSRFELRSEPDNSNAWSLAFSYIYMEYVEESSE